MMEKELPENWLKLPFTEVFDINGGTQPPKSQFIDEPQDGYIRLLQIRDFGKKPVPTYIPYKKTLKTCQIDDILIARYGASIGRIVTGQEGAYNVALAKVDIPDLMDKNFVKWILNSSLFQDKITSFQRTAQSGFNKNDLAGIIIPLPPLPEQQRIVAKLDSLFAHLENTKTRLEKVPMLLKNFRQAVLTQAVTGKLTEEWRDGKELINEYSNIPTSEHRDFNFELPTSWEIKAFGDVSEIKSNLVEPIKYWDFPLIAPDNIEKETGTLLDIPLVSDINPKSNKHFFEPESIVYSKIRPYLSKLIIADFEGLCSADMYPIQTKLELHYLFYYMLTSEFVSYASTAGERSVLPKINQKGMNIIPVPVPSKNEQIEIVHRVESLFAKADAIEAKYKLLKEKINNLPLTILSKAFKGELVEQLESDGSAEELLEEIRKQRNKPQKSVKKERKKISLSQTKNKEQLENELRMNIQRILKGKDLSYKDLVNGMKGKENLIDSVIDQLIEEGIISQRFDENVGLMKIHLLK